MELRIVLLNYINIKNVVKSFLQIYHHLLSQILIFPIYNFLNKSLINQKKKSITTELKLEYGKAIDKLHMKHQLCQFHSKQKVNRDIRNYLRENNITIDEKKT